MPPYATKANHGNTEISALIFGFVFVGRKKENASTYCLSSIIIFLLYQFLLDSYKCHHTTQAFEFHQVAHHCLH